MADERSEKRRTQDRLMEYVRVYWPLVIAMFFAVSTWAEYRFKVVDVARNVEEIKVAQVYDRTQMVANTTKIAVLEANLDAIKDTLDDAKKNTERILNRLDRGR